MSTSSIASDPTLGPDVKHKQVFRPFPTPLTWRQWGYILILQGVFAMFIDAGANFAVAYAMYHAQNVVKMWVFSENTVAGDLGVTPIIQTIASMWITSTLVHTDIHHGLVPPLPFVYPHVDHLPDPRIFVDKLFRRKNRETNPESEKVMPKRTFGQKIAYYWWMAIRFIFEGTEKNMLIQRGIGFKRWFGRFVWTGIQGAGLGVLLGLPAWIIAIIIVGPIYKEDNMGSKWAPQAIKAVYGGLYGLYSNPIIAIIALGAQSENHLVVVNLEEELEVGEAHGTMPENIHTISEEDEEAQFEAVSLNGDGGAAAAATAAGPKKPFTPTPSGTLAPPSPSFVRPYRANTTGHAPPMTGADQAGTSPHRSPLSALHPTRSRSGSVSRPPLTCNVSYIGSLPPAVTSGGPTPPLSATGAAPASAATLTPGRTPVRPSRPRGNTVSSQISASSFQYALGGTGGRAKRTRSRANTVTMAELRPGGIGYSSGGPGSSGAASPSASMRLNNVPVSPALSAQTLPPPQPGFMGGRRHRTQSDGGAPCPPHALETRRGSAADVRDVPGSSSASTASGEYDVFGRTTRTATTTTTAPTSPPVSAGTDVPEVMVQRPSAELEREDSTSSAATRASNVRRQPSADALRMASIPHSPLEEEGHWDTKM